MSILKTDNRSSMPPDPNAHLDGPRTKRTFDSEREAVQHIADLKAHEAKVGWQDLPTGIRIPGDLVASICTHCKQIHWVKPDEVNGECICHHSADAPAWKTRAMTKVEVTAWKKRVEASKARYLAEAPARRAILAAANRRWNEDDPNANRPLMSDPSLKIGRG